MTPISPINAKMRRTEDPELDQLRKRNKKLVNKIRKIKRIVEKTLNEIEPGLKEFEDGRLCKMLQALRNIREDLRNH